MKNILPVLFITLCCYKSLSQKIVVVDSLTKNPLPFVAIKFNESGFYTSQKGDFNLNQINANFFEVSLLGYKKAKLKTVNVKDTIFLTNDINQLDEVILSTKKAVTKELKLTKSPKKYGSWVLQPKSEILTSIYPTEEIKNFHIDKINIEFAKIREKIELKNSNVKAYVRLHLYEIENNKPSNSIYSSEPIDVNSFKKDNITFDISKNHITLSKDGIFIGLELIGYYTDEKIYNDSNPIVRPLLTDKGNNSYESKTFIRYIFKNQNHIISINDLIKRGMPKDKEITRYLNIGLEISN